jgi:hypothetical protein
VLGLLCAREAVATGLSPVMNDIARYTVKAASTSTAAMIPSSLPPAYRARMIAAATCQFIAIALLTARVTS